MNERDLDEAYELDMRLRDYARDVADDPTQRPRIVPEADAIFAKLRAYPRALLTEATVDLGEAELDLQYVRGEGEGASLRLGRYLRSVRARQGG